MLHCFNVGFRRPGGRRSYPGMSSKFIDFAPCCLLVFCIYHLTMVNNVKCKVHEPSMTILQYTLCCFDSMILAPPPSNYRQGGRFHGMSGKVNDVAVPSCLLELCVCHLTMVNDENQR